MNLFVIWLIILVLNQIIFYNSCFQLYCIKAALLHTGAVAFLVTFFISVYNKNKMSKNLTESIHEINSFTVSTPEINSRKSNEDIETEVLETLSDKETLKNKNYFPNEIEKIDTVEVSIPKIQDKSKIILDFNISYKQLYKNIPIYLKSKGIDRFYHFTDVRNLESIIESGGLYSWYSIKKKNINSIMSSGELSRQLDSRKGLEDFIRLSFVKNHPMKYKVEKEKGLNMVLLEIDISVACWESTLFSNINATDNKVSIGSDLNFLKRLNYDLFKQKYMYLDFQQRKQYQAEILVKNFLPIKYIKNIDKLKKKYLFNFEEIPF